MALTMIDIVQINKALNYSIDKVSVDDFYTFDKKSTASLEDVLDYLTKILVKLFESNDTNTKKMCKLIYHIKVFTTECFKADKTVDPELFIKLQNIIDTYENFEGPKEDIQDKMDEFITFLQDNNPLSQGQDLKVLQQLKTDKDNLLKKIEELEATISELTKEINHLTKVSLKNKKEVEKTKANNIKNDNNYTELKNDNKRLSEHISELEAKINLLEQKILRLNEQITELEKKLKDKDSYYDNIIKNLREELAKKAKTIETHKATIEEYAKEKKQQEDEELRVKNQEQKDNFICEVIINALLSSKHKLNDLKKILASLKINITDNELNYYLNIVKTKFNIKPTFRNGAAYYEINKKPNTSEILNIDMVGNEEINFLVLSNMYLSTFTTNQRKDIDSLYNYCIKNNINYIINLGNIFDFTLAKTPTFSDIGRFEELLNNILYKYPTDPSIYNFMLGGTIEESILSLGLNPIELLATSRSDFINLGYINATLVLGKNSLKNYILLHSSEYNGSIILPNKNTANSPYINLIAGDKASINLSLNSATTPSFSSDSLVRAFHMKVNFDPNKKINNIIFMPLIIDKKIVHTSSIHYTKYKTKKE